MYRFVSLLGLVVMLCLAWLMSSHKRRLNLRIIVGGLVLQFAIAAFVLRTRMGERLFEGIDVAFNMLLASVNAGSAFVFGAGFSEHYFAFKVLPTIIFFSAFMSIFYYYGIMQRIVGLFARVMQYTLGTSGAESLSAAAEIFVGPVESPLVIRPYVSSMTISELNSVMVVGLATLAGGVLGAFVEMGISAKHLLTASVITAPAGLLIAKILQPEVDQPKTLGKVRIDVEDPSTNVLEAITNGTISGVKLALNVGAMLIVFLSLVALVNLILGRIGIEFGFETADHQPVWSLEATLGWLFRPLAWLMGIPWEDCGPAGQLLGLKMATNEFVAYSRLADWAKPDSLVQLGDRSRVIMTYALCGFANFGSMGIQLGGLGGMAPDRRADLAKLALRAMLGGTLAAYMTACVAGLLL
jgi:CNT family concentrative nucleoside transporter